MGNYKTDHGFQIKRYSSDPPSPIAGEIWYNSTTQVLKVAPYMAAWASGGAFGSSETTSSLNGIKVFALMVSGRPRTG